MIQVSPPIVTVVVPTHHRIVLLRKLLMSLAAQTFPAERFEIVVVGSPDDAGAAVVTEFPQARFTTVPNDPSGGRNPSAKRNYGAQLARGTWLAFIDDDCVADSEWLSEGAKHFEGNVALEGAKVIPFLDPPTMTYRGLKLFEKPGGYQSCNIFFRRDLFLKLGGFDLRFPFYLEDSELAWSVLDAGHAIPHVAAAKVMHPVVPAAPWRLWDDTKRTMLMRLLQRKHPEQYRRAGTTVLRPWMWVLLALQLGAIGFGVAQQWIAAGVGLGLSLAGIALLLRKWFRGCRVNAEEVLVTALILPSIPAVRAIQYLRGIVRYRGPVVPPPELESSVTGN